MESDMSHNNEDLTARDIFGAALEIRDSAKQTEFIDICCGDDRELRRNVGNLLNSFLLAGDFMERRAEGIDQ